MHTRTDRLWLPEPPLDLILSETIKARRCGPEQQIFHVSRTGQLYLGFGGSHPVVPVSKCHRVFVTLGFTVVEHLCAHHDVKPPAHAIYIRVRENPAVGRGGRQRILMLTNYETTHEHHRKHTRYTTSRKGSRRTEVVDISHRVAVEAAALNTPFARLPSHASLTKKKSYQSKSSH